MICEQCENPNLKGIHTCGRDARNGAASAWQPIETAPKDGTKVLVCQAEGQYFCVQAAYWGKGDADWMVDIRLPAPGIGDPTHWMPLPEPPK